MGFIPPPRALTEEEYIKNNGRDIELEKWCRYSNTLGFIFLLWDKLLGKEIK